MSKWGEGIGTSVVVCKNPNKPSVDPAEKHGAASKKIEWLCSAKQWKKLNDWERKFIQDIYGTANLSRRQKMRLWVICDRISSNPTGEGRRESETNQKKG